ncbi:MAG: glycosyltransferase family 4 protein [Candidatus Kerfeldbacteria bacterium]|nr:glycosyltransferase family 4 protein [Candidatus Kerfeldbacteria bacterium]
MNIALLGPAFRSDQKEANVITLTSLARFFQSRGHRAIIISNREGSLPVHEALDGGVHIYRPHRWLDIPIGQGINPLLVVNQILSPAMAVRTVQRQARLRFDILHGFSAAPILAWREIIGHHLAPQAKLVHTIKSQSQYAVGSYRWSKALNRVDRVLVQNMVTKDHLMRGGVRPEKVQLMRSHINTEKFVTHPDKASLKKRYGYDRGPVIVYYGHLLAVKGVDRLVSIFALVRSKYPTARLLVGWSGLGSRSDFDTLVGKQGLSDAVDIITDEIPIVDLVNLADVAVFPYPHLRSTEANPSCILECIACRVPVVTSRLPELRELLQESRQVLMADSGNVQEYADQVVRLLADQSLRQSITDAAHGILGDYRLDTIGDAHLELYRNLMNRS